MSPAINEAQIAARLRESRNTSYSETPFSEFTGPPRPAAVLIPLVCWEGDWHLLFTRRTDLVEHHKGQVSFPGGATDPGDESPEQTALRELEEEIGVLPVDVRVLGRMGEYLTVTNFRVTPVVGTIPWPYCFKVHTLEVGRVFTVPLAWLAERENRLEFTRQETGRGVVVFLPYDGEWVWGATARMTVIFLEALGMLGMWT
jgi:8-oxo-dGTP pyrophosphatase MutT (NUDIX family)